MKKVMITMTIACAILSSLTFTGCNKKKKELQAKLDALCALPANACMAACIKPTSQCVSTPTNSSSSTSTSTSTDTTASNRI